MCTEEREKLIASFDKWFSTNPNQNIISAECANIAENYAKKIVTEYVDARIKELNPDGVSDNVTDLWVCYELRALKKKILNETK